MNFLTGLLTDENIGTGPDQPGKKLHLPGGGGQASPNSTKEHKTMAIIKTALIIFRILE